MARVAIHILTYNGAHYLPELFASLAQQSFRDTSVRILDNASNDETASWLATYARRFFPRAEIILNQTNTLFVGGHNTLFARARESYIMLVNQDTVLEPTYIERLVACMDENPRAGSASGLLLDGKSRRGERVVIDSAGLCVARNRRYTERKAGETIERRLLDRWPAYCEVFGVSGALPLYRTAAIKEAARGDELFDPLFEMYKEDIDLAHRLRAHGWTSYVVSAARAYHVRSIARSTERSARSFKARYCSYRNHLYLLMKHETRRTFIPDMFHILPHEFAKIIYLLCREPRVLAAWKEVARQYKYLKASSREPMPQLSIQHKNLIALKRML